MSLHFSLWANTDKLGAVEIRRLDKNPERSLITGEVLPDNVSVYAVTLDGKLMGEVDHRYGDGPWALAQKALLLITYRPAVRVNLAVDPGPVITGTSWHEEIEKDG